MFCGAEIYFDFDSDIDTSSSCSDSYMNSGDDNTPFFFEATTVIDNAPGTVNNAPDNVNNAPDNVNNLLPQNHQLPDSTTVHESSMKTASLSSEILPAVSEQSPS